MTSLTDPAKSAIRDMTPSIGPKEHCRKSTRDFQDHLTAHGAACAFASIAANNPSAWLPN